MSDKIVDLEVARRARTAQPAPEHVVMGDDGRCYYRFACEYAHADRMWLFDIWALDAAEAEARVAAIRQGTRVVGQIYGHVPTE